MGRKMVEVIVESEKVDRHEFSISYAGSKKEDVHSIDVQVLAPALLAISKLVREASKEFNQDNKLKAEILVVSHFEHKCFNINFELVLSFYEQIKTLIASDDVKSAKEILEWLGLLGLTSSGGLLTYLAYLRWKKGRKIRKKKIVKTEDGSNQLEVKVDGERNSVLITQNVFNLSENPRALRATRDAFLPLSEDGFDKVQLRRGHKVVDDIKSKEIENFVASCNVGLEEVKETEPEIEVTPAWLSVYSPVYDLAAKNWRFRLGRDVIYADISETKIAEDALKRGGALAEDAYQVRLEITTHNDTQGKKKETPDYKILEVTRFIPASPTVQTSFFEDSEEP